MEQFIRLLHECGMPLTDMDFINSDGPVMNKLLLEVSLVTISDLHQSLLYALIVMFI